MTRAELIITYSPQPEGAADGAWLNLEQEVIPLSERNATLADMVQMFVRAVSGLSARSYQVEKCSAATITPAGVIVVEVTLYAWPHDLALGYTLSSSFGLIGSGVPVEIEREVDVAIEGATSATLPWMVTAATAWWQIPCVNEFSEPLETVPTITIEGAEIRLSAPCYGVLRVRGLARGYAHTVTMEFSKSANPVSTRPAAGSWGGATMETAVLFASTPDPLGYAVTSVDVSVVASYVDGDGQGIETLQLTLPSCVLDLLEYCPDGTLAAQDRGDSVTTEIQNQVPVVYYDTCTGQVIELRYE